MCSGAIYWAGIRKVVYGFPAASLSAMTDGASGHPFEVEGPVLEAEAREVHEGFW
jgi:tRNA(Arg) A34 adenosine deaminase TadA